MRSCVVIAGLTRKPWQLTHGAASKAWIPPDQVRGRLRQARDDIEIIQYGIWYAVDRL
jgi:hypothetical protein